MAEESLKEVPVTVCDSIHSHLRAKDRPEEVVFM